MALETGIRIAIDSRGARAGANQVNKALDSMRGKALRTAKVFDERFDRLKNQLFSVRNAMLGLGGALVLGQAINTIGQFEDAMAGARAVTGATQEQFAAMSETARELGATTRFSAAEAAAGMEFLGRAGFETNEIIAAMPGTLDLAAAASLDLARAADIASNIMSGFNIQASEMTHVADVLAATAASANTNVEQLGEGMKFVAPIAKSLGISLETTAAAMGVLADAGIQGTLGGTGLRRVLATLVDPSKEAQKVLKAFGLTLQDIDPRSKSLTAVFRALKPVLEDTSAAFQIFDRQGASIALTLAENTDKLDELSTSFQDVDGTAARMAATMSDTLLGSLRQLKSAWDEFILSAGDSGLTGALRGVIDTMTQLVRVLAGSDEAWEKSTKLVKALTISVKLLVVALSVLVAIKIGAFFSALAGTISAAIMAFTAASTALGGFGAVVAALGGPITLTIGVVAALTTAFFVFREEIGKGIRALGEWLGLVDKIEAPQIMSNTELQKLENARVAYNNQIKAVRELEQQLSNVRRTPNAAIKGQQVVLDNLEKEKDKLNAVRKAYLKQREAVEQLNRVKQSTEPEGPLFPFVDTGGGGETAPPPVVQELDRFTKTLQDLEAQIVGTSRLINLRGASTAAIKRENAAIDARRQAVELGISGTEKEIVLKEKVLDLTNKQIELDRTRSLEKIQREVEVTTAMAAAVSKAAAANQDIAAALSKARVEQQAMTKARALDIEIGSEQYEQLLNNLRIIEANNKAIQDSIKLGKSDLQIKEQINAVEARDFQSGLLRAVHRFGDEATNTAMQVEDAVLRMADGMTGTLTKFFNTGRANLKDWAADFADTINSIVAKRVVNAGISALFGGASSGLAGSMLGGFANGGIASGPGVAVLGEGRFSKEAVIPLPDGKNVPVKMVGGDSRTVNYKQTINIGSDNDNDNDGMRWSLRQIRGQTENMLRREV